MPKILHDLAKKIQKSSRVSKSSAWAIATAQLQRQGKLKPGTNKLKRGK